MLRLVGCQCWSPENKIWLNISHYLESCKLISVLSKQLRSTILNFLFCFPNSLLFYVASWNTGFLVILIKPKTLGVEFCAIEVGIIFLKFGAFYHCCDFGYIQLKWIEHFDSF